MIIEQGNLQCHFAGPPLAPEKESLVEEYAEAGSTIEDCGASRYGTQANDSRKFGLTLCRLAGGEQPSIRLPLRSDMLREGTKAVTTELSAGSVCRLQRNSISKPN
jgi:hypothetical protein